MALLAGAFSNELRPIYRTDFWILLPEHQSVARTSDDNAMLQALGARIAERREQLGLSQESVARDAGIDRKSVSYAETGSTAATVIMLAKIAQQLDTTAAELLDGIA